MRRDTCANAIKPGCNPELINKYAPKAKEAGKPIEYINFDPKMFEQEDKLYCSICNNYKPE
jgi:hypothetical protein